MHNSMKNKRWILKSAVIILVILSVSACDLLPTEIIPTKPVCPPGGCETSTPTPDSQVVTPTSLFPDTTESPVPTETSTSAPTFTVGPTMTPGEATLTPETTETPYLPTGMAELTSTTAPGASPTPEFTATSIPVVSDKLYVLQEGTPRQIQNFAHSANGCNWMGVAGQVFGAGGAPMKNLVVVVTGDLDGQMIESLGLTGLAPAYGAGGFEIELGTRAVASSQVLSIQVFDLTGMELSDPYLFDTSSDCSSNLVIINFVPNS